MVLVGNHDTDKRLSLDGIPHLKDRRKGAGTLHLHLYPVIIFHMVANRPPGRIDGIGFRADVRRHGSRMRTPIVEYFWNMLYVFRLFRQPKNHVVILTPVILRPKQTGLLKKRRVEYREMTNIIIGPQIVRRIVRLKMQHDQIIQIRRSKRSLIRIHIICMFLADDFHTFIQKTWMHHIIMIE